MDQKRTKAAYEMIDSEVLRRLGCSGVAIIDTVGAMLG